MLAKARQVVLVENNATGQFGQVIKLHLGFDIEKKILKYDGLPFSVEQIDDALRPALA